MTQADIYRNQNQRDPQAISVDRDLGIKLVIPECDGKLKPDAFMDWLVCGKYFFTQANDGWSLSHPSGNSILQLRCDLVGRLTKEAKESKH